MLHQIKTFVLETIALLRDIADTILRHARPPAERPAPIITQIPPERTGDRRRQPRGEGPKQKAKAKAKAEAAKPPIALLQKPGPLIDLPAAPLDLARFAFQPPSYFTEDPNYRAGALGYANARRLSRQYHVIGCTLRKQEPIAVDFDEPFAHALIGPPSMGKSYQEGIYLEGGLLHDHYLGQLPAPLCGLALSYGHAEGGQRGAGQLFSVLPNHKPEEVRRLIDEYGTLPKGIRKVTAITVGAQAQDLHAAHPNVRVIGLSIPCHQLGIDGLKLLMVMDDKEDSLLAAEVSSLLRALPKHFTVPDIQAALGAYPFRNAQMRDLIYRRFELALEFIDDRVDLRALIEPGALIVIDIRDSWLSYKKAMQLFMILLNVFIMGKAPNRANLLVSIDEAHKFLAYRPMKRLIEYLIKERRHLGISMLLSSQNPTEIPHSTLSELDGLSLFGTSSEEAIAHLARSIEPFTQIKAREAAQLKAGQMVYWAKHWHCPREPGVLDGCLVRVALRPRLSMHGGESLRAMR